MAKQGVTGSPQRRPVWGGGEGDAAQVKRPGIIYFLESEKMAKKYDERHGGPYDRGGADSYYRRGYKPHYYTGSSLISEEIPEELMTSAEIEAYRAGYNDNEDAGDFKDWG